VLALIRRSGASESERRSLVIVTMFEVVLVGKMMLRVMGGAFRLWGTIESRAI